MINSSQNSSLVQALTSIGRQIERCLRDMPDEMHAWQPGPDEWSAQMVVAHLLRCEPRFQKRLEQIASEDNPVVAEFGPEQVSPHSDESFEVLLHKFKQNRGQTLEQIYTYSPEDWQRPAVHTSQGETTLGEQIRNIANHDLEHIGQLYDLCEMWQENGELFTDGA